MDLDNLSLSPANFKKRFTASLIDLFLPLFIGLLPAAAVTYSITGPLNYKTYYLYIFLTVFWFTIYFANVIFYQIRTGRTLGKLIMGIKVCYPNNKIDVRKEDLIKREMGKLFTLITAGHSFFSKYKEEEILAFHDEYSKTIVLVLPEDHEEYLYEYHYEDYFTSEEEEEEYNKLMKEKEELEKIDKEREKQEKEYQKQLKKEQKTNEKTEKDKKKEIEKSNLNPNIQEIKENSGPPLPNGMNGFTNIDSTPSFNEDMNNVQTYQEGVNIVGNDDFLSNSQQDNSSKNKLKGLFSNKKSQNSDSNILNNNESNYSNPKLSGLVQDDTYLPSENIYSEIYKGWNMNTSHQEDVKDILNKKKKAI